MSKYIYDESRIITQGGILKDLTIPSIGKENEIIGINLSYAVVISQACDIEQSRREDGDNYYLPNIMILLMYILESFKEGRHLIDCGYKIQPRSMNSGEIKKLKNNSELNRYHFLAKGEEYLFHDTIIDFKHYFTLSTELIVSLYGSKYIATIDYLYRESLSQRFCNYLNRIGLPSSATSEL